MTLELYVLRRLIVGMAIACGGMTMIAIPCVLVHAVQKAAGIGLGAVFSYMPILLLELAPYLIPISFLLSLVSTYGRLAADNEWTAINMAGIHPFRTLRPAAVLAVIFSCALYFIASNVAPSLHYQKNAYGKSTLMQVLRRLNPGGTGIHYQDFFLSAQERDETNRNVFRQAVMHIPMRKGQPAQFLFAQSIELSFEGSMMYAGVVWPRWADDLHSSKLGRVQINIDLDQFFTDGRASQSGWKYQSSDELATRIARSEAVLASGGDAALVPLADDSRFVPLKDLRWARFDLHAREALAAVCVMFLLLGVPTGLLMRHGSQLAALAAGIVYALFYYILSMRIGKGLAGADVVPEWLAAWGTTMAGCLLGVWLLRFALRR